MTETPTCPLADADGVCRRPACHFCPRPAPAASRPSAEPSEAELIAYGLERAMKVFHEKRPSAEPSEAAHYAKVLRNMGETQMADARSAEADRATAEPSEAAMQTLAANIEIQMGIQTKPDDPTAVSWGQQVGVLLSRADAERVLAALSARPAAEPSEAAEALARRFHETYERLAPRFGYETRRESAKPWEEVPEQNRRLMVAVCAEILAALAAARAPETREQIARDFGNEHGNRGANMLIDPIIRTPRQAEIRRTTAYDVRGCLGTHYHVTCGGEDLMGAYPTAEEAWEAVETILYEADQLRRSLLPETTCPLCGWAGSIKDLWPIDTTDHPTLRSIPKGRCPECLEVIYSGAEPQP